MVGSSGSVQRGDHRRGAGGRVPTDGAVLEVALPTVGHRSLVTNGIAQRPMLGPETSPADADVSVDLMRRRPCGPVDRPTLEVREPPGPVLGHRLVADWVAEEAGLPATARPQVPNRPVHLVRPGGRRPVHPVSYTHLRAHETRHDLVCRLLLEKKKKKK